MFKYDPLPHKNLPSAESQGETVCGAKFGGACGADAGRGQCLAFAAQLHKKLREHGVTKATLPVSVKISGVGKAAAAVAEFYLIVDIFGAGTMQVVTRMERVVGTSHIFHCCPGGQHASLYRDGQEVAGGPSHPAQR